MRRFTHDSLAITGSIIGLLSVLPGWLTLKPNRLASGASLELWESVGWTGTAIILGLWLGCFALSLVGKRRGQAVALGIIANLVLVTAFLLSGSTARQLLAGEAPVARVSLSTGVWVTALGVYILISACRQRLKASPLWKNLVSWVGLTIVGALLAGGWLNDLSVVKEFIEQKERFGQELSNHVVLFGGSVLAGAAIGIPLGIWATRNRRAEKPIFFFANITQTIPSLALFGLLIAPLSALSFAFPVLREWGIRGIGAAPAVIALILYSLLPIARNTYVGLNQLDPAVIDAGIGMGMSRSQVFRRIELPLSIPLVLEGVRIAAVQAVGNTAVAALIGAGGLGWFIFQGLGQAAFDVIILGAIPIIALALAVDAAMRIMVRAATPRTLRE